MWSSGDGVLLRFIRFGQVRMAVPHILVQDEPDLVVTYLPVGTPAKMPVQAGRPIRGQADRDWELRDHVWDSVRELRLTRPRDRHSIEVLWDAASDDFRGWYVNVEEPLARSPLGFDTDDLALDIRIEPDGSWAWKDEDELEALVEAGRFTRAQADEIRAEGERVLDEWPFPTGWEGWRPDPAWAIPRLPEGWDVV